MTWRQQINGCWLAQGKNGNFLIWRDGEKWHAKYLSSDGGYLIIVPGTSNFILIKSACEESSYWENNA